MIRSLRIEKVPSTTLYCIKWNGGGEVPAELAGHYTTTYAAQQAINIWKSNNGREEVKEESPSPDVVKTKFEKNKAPIN